MFLSGSYKLCSKDQYSFITIFEEFKQSCWGAEINRKFLFHTVNSMGELSTGHDRSSTTILAHERELWVCYSECQVYIGMAWRNTEKQSLVLLDAAWEESTTCFVFGVWDQQGRSACWPDHCVFRVIQSRCEGYLSRYVSILL